MKLAARVSVSVFIAAALVIALMVWGDVSPKDALHTVLKLPPHVYLIALGMHTLLYCLRALRCNLLLPRERRPSFKRSLIITGAHNMASYVLPAKTGEASLVVYLRMQAGVPSAVGLASLLVSRLLDGATLCLGLSIACLWLSLSGRYEYLDWLGSAGLALIALCGVFAALSVRGDVLVRLIAWCARWLKVHHLRIGEGALKKANQLAVALRSTRSGGRLALAAFVTVPVWLLVFGFYALLAREMGLPRELSFAEATFGSSLAVMFNLLPINAMAGVGTQELGWVTGFNKLLGVDESVALSTGIGCHVIQLFNVVAMGIVAHLLMGVMPRLRFDPIDKLPAG